jgi:hypothetical protein
MQSSNLSSLNIQNGNNTNITSFNCTQNLNLSCIQVDDVAYSTTNWIQKPAGASYSLDCQCNTSSSITIPVACGSYTAPDGQVYYQSGNYIAVIPNAAGCDSTITIDLQAVVWIHPDIIYSTSSTLLYNDSGDNLQWVDCNNSYAPIPGENSNVFTPSYSGSFALEVTFQGCTLITNCLSVEVLSIDEHEAPIITIYPNPVQNELFIDLTHPAELEIYTITGNRIQSVSTSKIHIIDVSSFESGVYLVKVGNQTQRFIKQ